MTLCATDRLFLTEDECYAVLEAGGTGRVNFTRHVLPSSVPVRFELRGTELVLHAPEPSRLPQMLDGAAVSFEVQVADPLDEAGLRVVVVGTASVGGTAHQPVVRVRPLDVTGHRLPLPRAVRL